LLMTFYDFLIRHFKKNVKSHVVGKTLINVFHCDFDELRFLGKPVIIETFS